MLRVLADYRCLQTPYADVLSGFDLPGEESEDCLYLNIYTPETEGKRPVMVWIHGGGHQNGSGSMMPYRSNALAERGVVMVTGVLHDL